MLSCLLSRLAVCAVIAASAPASAVQPNPPAVPLWSLDANGDAIQHDLGFVLPQLWNGFQRKGFTSTRDDGGSVITYYERPEGPLRMRILIQLRVDVRGTAVAGADGIERNWPLIQKFGPLDYRELTQQAPERIADAPVPWGTGQERPNARMQLLRYALDGGPEIQGLWYRNIGLWAVAVTVSGPDSRRADIEAAGRAAMNDMKWPSAPLNADLRSIAPEFLSNVQSCESADRSGTGSEVKVDKTIAMEMGIAIARTFFDDPPAMAHPVLGANAYCRLERFQVGDDEVIALAWRGDPAAAWSARWAFMVARSGTFFQVESTISPAFGAAPRAALGIRKAVQLTWSDDRRVKIIHTFTDWPSYEVSKALVTSAMARLPRPIVEVRGLPRQIDLRIDPGMTVELPAAN